MIVLSLLQRAVLGWPQYDPELGQKCSYWAATVYYPHQEILSGKCRYCTRFQLTDVRVHQNLKFMVQSLVAYYQPINKIVVAFRGTINLQNWAEDFDITQVDYKDCRGCKIHKGFYQNYNVLKGFVTASLTELVQKYQSAEIVVTGHSMGAAMALTAALDLVKQYPQVKSVYTLGQPRLGNKQFALYVATVLPCYRLIHDKDLVPHVPTHKELDVFVYYHGPRQIWFTKEMSKTGFKECREVGEDPDCSDSLGQYTMAEHAANFYVMESDSQ